MKQRRSAPITIDPDDVELFRTTVGPVRPVKSNHLLPRRPPPPPRPTQTWRDEQEVLRDTLSDHFDAALVETGEELIYARPGVSHRQLMKLRRGEFAVHAELDLHGHSVDAARAALAEFLHRCKRSNARCVRIIHGKGNGSRHRRPVIKNKVNGWLQQWNDVIAFCSARPMDGGTGAVYVLLRAG